MLIVHIFPICYFLFIMIASEELVLLSLLLPVLLAA